ncbi:F0F1 ATP synthase subunit delta [Rugosimonospora acidiphila]|uniref:ATP synthase subunit delta n=1 Tax=Rugosimonospora acidiphila TaxID=556531 RepID=A0ABP9RQD7_9ACTN
MQTSTDRDAYRAAEEKLEALAPATAPDRLSGIADDVLAVAELLDREPRLRRALADGARDGQERAELLRGLLAGKVSDEAVDLAAALATGRWSSPTQLLGGVERLGVAVLLSAANRADELGEVEDELFRFNQVVDGSPQLASVLSDPTTPPERRGKLVSDLLDGKARPVTVRLVRLALAGFGGRGFSASLTRLVELAAAGRDRQVAYVTAAALLTDDEERRLGERLEQMYGRRVSVRVRVDPTVIGGLSVRVGSDLYDGTVLRRLSEARGAMGK